MLGLPENQVEAVDAVAVVGRRTPAAAAVVAGDLTAVVAVVAVEPFADAQDEAAAVVVVVELSSVQAALVPFLVAFPSLLEQLLPPTWSSTMGAPSLRSQGGDASCPAVAAAVVAGGDAAAVGRGRGPIVDFVVVGRAALAGARFQVLGHLGQRQLRR